MDITAYWLNHKIRDAGEGKVYYLYPYTRCEADDTPTLFIGGKHYIRIAVSEEEWTRLRKLDDKEYNSERRAHNKRWTADIPRLRDEDGEEIDFWSDRAEDRETRYIEGDICEEIDRRALVRSFDKTDRRMYLSVRSERLYAAGDRTKAASRSGNRLASSGEDLHAPGPHAAARRRSKPKGACL